MKVCTGCGFPKPISEFYKHKEGKYGVIAECKPCFSERSKNYYHTIPGLITVIYNHQKLYSKRQNYPPPTYTRNQLLQFTLSSLEFHRLFDDWVGSSFDKWLSPSFDREDDSRGYSFDNFNKWMPWQGNFDKGHLDQINGINTKQCKAVIGTHKITGEIIEFHSISEAERQTGIRHGSISACCLNKIKLSGDYKWKFKTVI